MLGIGLINGSLAAVLRRQGAAGEIVAYARQERTRARAVELGLCDRAEADPAAAVAGADLVVLGVPPAAVGDVAAAMRPGLSDEAIVTDVSSIKAQVVRDVVPHLPDPSLFVPGPPGRRHRAFRPGRGLRHPVRAAPLHPDADRGHRPAGGRAGPRDVGAGRLARSTP